MPFWGELAGVWKVSIAICGIFAVGMTVGAGAAWYRSVPERLTVVERKVEAIERLIATQLCLDVAEKENTNWRLCLKDR